MSESRAHVLEINVREEDHPILVTAGSNRLEPSAQRGARIAAQIHEHAQIQPVHRGNHLVELRGAHRVRLMAVDVDGRKLRARPEMLRHDER